MIASLLRAGKDQTKMRWEEIINKRRRSPGTPFSPSLHNTRAAGSSLTSTIITNPLDAPRKVKKKCINVYEMKIMHCRTSWPFLWMYAATHSVPTTHKKEAPVQLCISHRQTTRVEQSLINSSFWFHQSTHAGWVPRILKHAIGIF